MSWGWEMESEFEKQEGSLTRFCVGRRGGQGNQEPKAMLPNTWHQ